MEWSPCWQGYLEQNPKLKCIITSAVFPWQHKHQLLLSVSNSNNSYFTPQNCCKYLITASCITCLPSKCHSHFIIEILCYDDGCHLKKYTTNPSLKCCDSYCHWFGISKTSRNWMHFKGHTDPWCQEHCDPNKVKELHNVHNRLN